MEIIYKYDIIDGWARKVAYFNGIRFIRQDHGRNKGYYIKHGTSLHREVWKCYNGEIPDGYEVHHKNNQKFPNFIENLELLSTHDHLIQHKRKSKFDEKFELKSSRLCESQIHYIEELVKLTDDNFSEILRNIINYYIQRNPI